MARVGAVERGAGYAERGAAEAEPQAVWRCALALVTLLLACSGLVVGAVAEEPPIDSELEDALSGFEGDDSDAEALSGFGDDDPDADILSGFEDDEEADFASGAPVEAERWWDLSGDFVLGASYNYIPHYSSSGTFYGNLQKLRTKLALQFDAELPGDWELRFAGYGFYDFAYLMHGRENYTEQVLELYEYWGEIQDAYVEGSVHDQVDLKIGRQVVNFGRSETFRLLDIVNPVDNREPGVVDLEDIRRSTAMLRMGFFHGPWTLTGLVIPELRFDLLPPFGSDFFPEIPDIASVLTLDDLCNAPDSPLVPDGADLETVCTVVAPPGDPLRDQTIAELQETYSGSFPDPGDIQIETMRPASWDASNIEYALNLTGIFRGWDISFQGAYYWDDLAHVDLATGTLRHARLWMVGTGGNYTWGSWLFKLEAAYVDGLRFMFADGKKSRFDIMGGIEYFGFSETSISFEIVNRHLFDYEDRIGEGFDATRENDVQLALRITREWLNARLRTTLLASSFGLIAQGGSFVRLSAEYEITDAFKTEGGVVFYQSGDNIFFRNIEDNDRLFLNFKYSF
ncbi:MAG: hypothetical protein JRG96_00560 [Deltaproteobacteria bacterium]|nr:hypothetical protein [Deltaproteobacteria bacterium]